MFAADVVEIATPESDFLDTLGVVYITEVTIISAQTIA